MTADRQSISSPAAAGSAAALGGPAASGAAGASRPTLFQPARPRWVRIRLRPDICKRVEAQAAQHDVKLEAVLQVAIQYGLEVMERP